MGERMKVFWFFFSKKNALSCYRSGVGTLGTGKVPSGACGPAAKLTPEEVS